MNWSWDPVATAASATPAGSCLASCLLPHLMLRFLFLSQFPQLPLGPGLLHTWLLPLPRFCYPTPTLCLPNFSAFSFPFNATPSGSLPDSPLSQARSPCEGLPWQSGHCVYV